MLKRELFLLLATVVLAGCSGGSQPTHNCTTKDQCFNDKNCQCWCSVKCGYRKKTANDSPLYIENDPNGKFCYCQQRDIDLYDQNCAEGAKPEQAPAEAE